MQNPELIALRLSQPMNFFTLFSVASFLLWLVLVNFWAPGVLSAASWAFASWLGLGVLQTAVMHLLYIVFFFEISRRVRLFSRWALVVNFAILSAFFFTIVFLAVRGTIALPSVYAAQLQSGANRPLLIALMIILAGMALATIFFIVRRWYRDALDTFALLKYRGHLSR